MEAEFGSACLFFEHVQVIDMPEHNPGQMGGTMRLGKRRTLFQTKNSVMSKSCLPLAGPAAAASRMHVLGCCWALAFWVPVLLLKFFPPF